MTPYRYARNTKVTIDKSRSEIERFLRKRGITEFISGFTTAEAQIQFTLRSYRIRMAVPLTEVVRGKPVRVDDRTERSRWRALLLVLKAKLAAVDANITTLQVEFLPYLMTEHGITIAQEIDRVGLGLMLDGKTKLLPSGNE